MRDTSVITYYELVSDGYISDRCQLVYDYLKNNPDLTDSEVSDGLGFDDPNNVRPRRKDLFDIGLVESNGKRDCTMTGRLAYQWRVKPFVDKKKFYDSKEVKESGFVNREFRSINLLQITVMVHLYLLKYTARKYDAKVLSAKYDRGLYQIEIRRRDY